MPSRSQTLFRSAVPREQIERPSQQIRGGLMPGHQQRNQFAPQLRVAHSLVIVVSLRQQHAQYIAIVPSPSSPPPNNPATNPIDPPPTPPPHPPAPYSPPS